MKEFNINNRVKVMLNEVGIGILKERHEKLKKIFPDIFKEFKIPETDKQGYTEFQLWYLMSIFGSYMTPGFSFSPFDTNIAIDDELLVDKSNDLQHELHR